YEPACPRMPTSVANALWHIKVHGGPPLWHQGRIGHFVLEILLAALAENRANAAWHVGVLYGRSERAVRRLHPGDPDA
ncbi:MAG: hypothetical protein ACKOBR_11615, partial [Actinomycetota bacterium]